MLVYLRDVSDACTCCHIEKQIADLPHPVTVY